MSPEAVRALYAKYGIAPDGGSPESAAVVWKRLPDGRIEPVKIALGITDHTFTAVTSVLAGRLEPGDDVVTSTVAAKNLPPGASGIRR